MALPLPQPPFRKSFLLLFFKKEVLPFFPCLLRAAMCIRRYWRRMRDRIAPALATELLI